MLGIILAALGLGFLIFIHELGHYFMAKKVGMKVETFSVGFGSPLLSWIRPNGEKWQLGWLPFGGYVKIKGTERDGDLDPYDVSDGFFGRGPWNRVKVAFMGPFVNLVFAFLVFVLLFALGGRDQPFSNLTTTIGAVDPKSELYIAGFRPGDEILSYGNEKVTGIKSHFLAPIIAEGQTDLSIRLHDWTKGTVEDKQIPLSPYTTERHGEKAPTFGVVAPGSFITFNPPWIEKAAISPKAPIQKAGIEPGDTIVWYDGMPTFSQSQLNTLVQDGNALVVIDRSGELLVRRVPRVPLSALKLDSFTKDELRDWTYEARLSPSKDGLLFIPYNISSDGTVEGRFRFIDKEDEIKYIPEHLKTDVERSLQVGDRIVSVDGEKVSTAPDILKLVQTHTAHLIVYRNGTPSTLSQEETQSFYDKIHDERAFSPLIKALTDPALPKTADGFALLNGVTPKPLKDWSDKDKESTDQTLYLGLPGLADRPVNYNPNPFQQFSEVSSEIGTTLGGLVSGHISPKWVSGPVGIVRIMSTSWADGFKSGIFWLGVISLNLAFINLLPLPVLDGGTILFGLIEIVTGRKFSLKLIDKLIFPFALALIALILFFTYNDVLRLFGSLILW